MNCPHCQTPTLRSTATEQGTLVDACSRCHGLWLDRGVIYDFCAQPQQLEQTLEAGLRSPRPSDRSCPRCDCPLETGTLHGTSVERCGGCGGLWFDAGEVTQVLRSASRELHIDVIEPVAESDPALRAAAEDRRQQLAVGMLALPNLFIRSILTLTLLYGILTLVLITLVQLRYLGPSVALGIGVVFAVLQFTIGPWLMDLSLAWVYRFSWVGPDQLPDHLREFVERVAAEQKIKFPSFGIIHDGAPTAFTYGHHPNNARVVISEGILSLLEPAEVEAVVAHELGHACHWDMALMTVANLVPLLLYYLYRVATDWGGGKKDKDYAWAVSLGAYVLYVVSEYVVLWFSRTREYFADRFAGQVTNNPNALATALVKIAYGLAAQPQGTVDEKGEKKERQEAGAMGALNIFDRRAAVGLVVASSQKADPAAGLDLEQVKGAMQWDLWNPWAKYYELHSTHPLVAKRLLHLSDQAAHQGQDPAITFDRRQPESYWDDFLIELSILVLPTTLFLAGLAAFVTAGLLTNQWHLSWLGVGVALAGAASLFKTNFSYRRDFFPHLSVAALLHKVKVSAVRPVPVTLTGTIIGKGVPGLIYSDDFVLRDRTGILFLDYTQPLALWEFFFGLLKAGAYQGKDVRVSGWYRRAPVPYLEVNRIETLDSSIKPRRCYAYHARMAFGVITLIAGVVGAALALLA